MTARPFRDLCPEADERDAMNDGQFWERVLVNLGGHLHPEPFDDGRDLDTVQLDASPCTECGEVGACAYDPEGRALIHAKGSDDDD